MRKKGKDRHTNFVTTITQNSANINNENVRRLLTETIVFRGFVQRKRKVRNKTK